MRIITIISSVLLAIAITVIAGPESGGKFTLKTSAFSDGGRIPLLYTCNGDDVSPELSWDNPPLNTQAYALILSVADPMTGGTFYSWVIYNIPKDTKEILQGGSNLTPETLYGNNSFRNPTYYGPCPADSRLHHYVFTLYALDATLDISEGEDPEDVLAEISKHVINHTELTGTFSH